jgi:hypothetical protein
MWFGTHAPSVSMGPVRDMPSERRSDARNAPMRPSQGIDDGGAPGKDWSVITGYRGRSHRSGVLDADHGGHGATTMTAMQSIWTRTSS